MRCPQCNGDHLEASELEPGMVAAACRDCKGSLLPLLNYRYWSVSESGADTVCEQEELSSKELNPEDNKKALLCPKCARMMLKYRIGVEPGNRIDLCASCDEIWLDAGEWDLLKQHGLHTKLPAIVTDVWQRQIRQQRQNQLQQQRYEKLLGKEAFSKCQEFKEWLSNQSEKEQIKQYLIS